MSRVIRSPNKPLRVAIADDSGLVYSDDYRDGWAKGFRAVGCEVQTFDISPLRRINGINSRSPYSTNGIRGYPKMIAENIVRWNADIVWCHHGRAAANDMFMQQFRRKGIPVCLYLCDEPYETGETARYSPHFDYVFTMDPCTVDVHRKGRKDRGRVFYLPPGCDTDRFTYADYSRRKLPGFFLGNATLVPRPKYLKPVEKLYPDVDIRYWHTTPKGAPAWIGIEDHPEWYQKPIVGLNVHRSPWMDKGCWQSRVKARGRHMEVPPGIKIASSPPAEWGTGFWNEGNLPAAHVNPRFFEMASCGTCVISDDDRSELARMFPMAPRAQDPDHFLELVGHYLKHPHEAEEIGRVCSSLISKRHSYRHRAAEILIRLGLQASLPDDQGSFLEGQEDWLTPQDLNVPGVRLSSAPTGRSERWSPASGLSWIRGSGRVSETDSLDAPTPWAL